jgi:GNAT superfamily N-acetyltransferase
VEVRAVAPDEVRPLRHAVLRPRETLAGMAWPGDDDPRTLHVAAGDPPVAVATVTPEPHPHAPRDGDFRVRGMATAPSHRGRGLGAALLARLLDHAAAQGGTRAWCWARVGARGLYARAGFLPEGDVVELDHIGPHVLMSRPLRATAPPPRGPSTPPSAPG